MSKRANAGELRIPVNFMRIDRTTDTDGFPVEVEVNVFCGPIYAKWVNAHGSEVFEYMTLKLREPATLMVRYSNKITPQLKVYRVGDSDPYEIISIDNVEERNEWLEIKVQRSEAAR